MDIDEAAVRVLIGGGGVAVVAVTALLGRRWERRHAEQGSLNLSGVVAGVILFSDAACGRCDLVRLMLEEAEVEFLEIGYETDPAIHRKVGVEGVPLVVVRDMTGETQEILAGVPSERRLQRALSQAG